jgi:hypothetical protein
MAKRLIASSAASAFASGIATAPPDRVAMRSLHA